MLKLFRASFVMMALFIALCGLAYPFAITGIAKLLFPAQAAGGLVERSGHVVGSRLIAQGFSRPEYLHPRPSAAGNGYDAVNSSGSNFGPMDKKLIDRVAGDAAKIRADNPDAVRAGAVLPADAVTASGSGLDPDISPGYAALQAPRIAKARGLAPSEVEKVLADATREPTLGVLGERRVNVLEANLALDALQPRAHPGAR